MLTADDKGWTARQNYALPRFLSKEHDNDEKCRVERIG